MNEINHELGIIALESCRELGQQVNKIIQQKRNTEESFLIPTNEIRFSNGEGKVKLPETVRGKDIYILCDVGNTDEIICLCRNIFLAYFCPL